MQDRCSACQVMFTDLNWSPMIVQWNTLFPKSWLVCVPCVESKLGRRIVQEDLTDCWLNLDWKDKQRPDLLTVQDIHLLTPIKQGSNL